MPLLPHAELSCLSLETLDMKSAAMNRVLGDLTSAQSNPSSEAGAYAWLNLPAVSSVAVTPDSNRELLDEVDRLIASYSEFPHGYPENKKTDEFRIRIRYRRTNDQQASASFTNILENYRAHVLHKRASELTAYPFTLEYLIADPLGREELDISDTRIFRNANRLTAAAANGGAVTDLTEGGDDDSDSNGDTQCLVRPRRCRECYGLSERSRRRACPNSTCTSSQNGLRGTARNPTTRPLSLSEI